MPNKTPMETCIHYFPKQCFHGISLDSDWYTVTIFLQKIGRGLFGYEHLFILSRHNDIELATIYNH